MTRALALVSPPGPPSPRPLPDYVSIPKAVQLNMDEAYGKAASAHRSLCGPFCTGTSATAGLALVKLAKMHLDQAERGLERAIEAARHPSSTEIGV